MSAQKRRGRGRAAGGSNFSRYVSSSSGNGTDNQADRSLRQKPEKQYKDGFESDSDEELLQQTFSVQEKLQSPKFPMYFVKELVGEEVTLEYFQRSGFNVPLVIRVRDGLGMTMPDDTFTVTDVKNAVGARRTIEVMDCTTQKNSEMNMKDWEEYYNNPNRDSRKLNVISLEFSFTKLEPYVVAPKVVRQIDWVDNVWPRHLKELQTEGTNDLREMKYPKVQKYCLMSVAGCYTDFHVDFGGTSVWYHIVKGKKVFWLIPPTETNLKMYEQWTLSGKQGNIFFGDLVEKCGKVTLEKGNTFFIPSGWIHAVYTPEDSLVFGGNFLHSFAMEKQIRVAQIEEITKVPQKFRFPFFTELQWYALDKYVFHLLGKTHLHLDEEAKVRLLGSRLEQQAFLEAVDHPHVTPQELFGLKAIVMYIHALAVSKKNVPHLLPEPINLVRDIRELVDKHKNDDPALAVTGKPLLFWPAIKNDPGFMRPKAKPRKEKVKDPMIPKKEHPRAGALGGKKVDRVPCNICQACISPDCGSCQFCADMIRFGGSGKLKRPCLVRQCLQPILPQSTVCNICGLDGWYAQTSMKLIDRPPGSCSLMECCICYEVTHPTCVTDYGVDGYMKTETPNSWECPKCVKAGHAIKLEPPPFSPSGLPTNLKQDSVDGGPPMKVIKIEEEGSKKILAYGSDSTYSGHQLFSVKGKSDQSKQELRVQLADQILSASTKTQKEPLYVFRPPPMQLSAEEIYERREKEFVDLKMERGIMMNVFKLLTTIDLSKCVVVCKAWSKLIQDPMLWNTVNLHHKKLTSHLLSLTVQRQPIRLSLSWSKTSKQQLTWLLPRIPQTRSLSLCGLEYGTSVTALATVNCPMLQELDLSYVTNLNDAALYKMLASPKDSRPGLLDKKSRMKLLKILRLAGTEISDVGLRYITQYLSHLHTLDISSCWKVSDSGMAQISMPDSKTVESLQNLDISGCKGVANSGLHHLTRCRNLATVNCLNTSITHDAMKKFAEESTEKLKVQGSVIKRRQSKR